MPEPIQEPGSSPPELRGFLPVFKNRNFLLLWLGQVFSQIADKVYLVLAIALIANHFQPPGQTISAWVSAVMIAFTIPAIVLGSIAGVYVDRWQKKTVLVATNLLRGGLVFSMPVLLWGSNDWQWIGIPVGFEALLLVTLLVSSLTQFFAPAEQAVIPLIVKEERLLAANSLYTTTMMASVILGFALGEPLLKLADLAIGQEDLGRELVVGGSYVLAGLILLFVRTRERDLPPEVHTPHIWEDIKEGLMYLGKHHQVRSALIQLVLLFSVFAALAVLAVRLAEVIPQIESDQFGFLLSAGGVGMAVGAALLGNLGHHFSHRQLSLFGSTGMALSLGGLALLAGNLLPALGCIACLGLFAAIVGIPMQTTIQAETPEHMRGKIFGLQNNATNIALSLPLALAGIVEGWIGLNAVFALLAMLVMAGGLLTWYISSKHKA